MADILRIFFLQNVLNLDKYFVKSLCQKIYITKIQNKRKNQCILNVKVYLLIK